MPIVNDLAYHMILILYLFLLNHNFAPFGLAPLPNNGILV